MLALLVVRDPEPYLPRALAALAAQTRPPDRLVVAPATPAAGAAPEPVDAEWVWLLRDDAAPEPQALERLLAEVETAPSVAVAGCKQVSWDDAQRLLDVGFTTSPLGAVVTGVDRGEVDQGQHDGRSDVLAVAAAGMLVRADVWQALGRPSDGLTGAREDLDLCRRVHLAGHRVVVVPGAVVARVGGRDFADDRRAALHLRLAGVAWPLLPLALAWSVLAALARAAFRLVLKQPRHALDELLALVAVLGRPQRWVRARLRNHAVRRVPRRTLRPLRARPRQLLRLRRDELAAWIVPTARRAPRARVWRLRMLAVAPVLTLVAVSAAAAGWRLVTTSGAIVGPYLPAVPSSASSLLAAAVAPWRPIGLGAPGIGDPLGAVLAVLSVPLGADPGRLVAVLLVAGPLLAAGTAWLATVAVTASDPRYAPLTWVLRSWVPLAWAGAPTLLAALVTGRPGVVLAHIVMPLLGLALLRVAQRGSVTAAAAGGVLLTVVLASAPALTVPAVIALVALGGWTIAHAGLPRSLLLTITTGLPVVLLLPWWAAVVRHPVLLLADPALGWAGGRDWAGGSDWAPAGLVAAPVVLLALVGLLRRGAARDAAVVCWSVALAGLGVALVGERSVLAHGSRSWPGAALTVCMVGLLAAALVAAPALASRLRRRSPVLRHGAVAVLALLLGVGPVVALGTFAWQGWTGSWPGVAAQRVHRGAADVLPGIAAAEAASPAASRTLALAVDGGRVRWSLERAAGPALGDSSAEAALLSSGASSSTADGALVQPVIAALLSDTAADVRVQLADLAVESVLLLPPIDPTAEQALAAAPGLVRVSAARGGRGAVLWRVEPAAGTTRPARVRVLDRDGSVRAALPSTGLDVDTTLPALPAGTAGRLLALAERSDPGWHAALDGQALQRVDHAGWAQAFVLPDRPAGRLTVTYAGDVTTDLDGLRWAALLVGLLIALPTPRVRHRVATPRAARRSTPVVRDPSVIDLSDLQPTPQVFDDDYPKEQP